MGARRFDNLFHFWVMNVDRTLPVVPFPSRLSGARFYNGLASWLRGLDELTAWVGRIDTVGWAGWLYGLDELFAWRGRVVCMGWTSWLRGLNEFIAWAGELTRRVGRVDCVDRPSWLRGLGELTQSTSQRCGLDSKGWASWLCVLWIRRVDSVRVGWIDLLLGKMTL